MASEDTNMAVVSGSVADDPELRRLGESQFPVLEFRLKTQEWNRVRKELVPNFLNIKILGKASEDLGLEKGDYIMVAGKIERRRWKKDEEWKEKWAVASWTKPFRGEGPTEVEKVEDEGEGEDGLPF